MTQTHAFLLVLVIAVVTAGIRFLPFIIFSGKRTTPSYIVYLSNVLPYAIMGMLVVYCLRNIHVTEAPHGLPELLACLLVAGLHIKKRNTLLSIVGGTALYMVLLHIL